MAPLKVTIKLCLIYALLGYQGQKLEHPKSSNQQQLCKENINGEHHKLTQIPGVSAPEATTSVFTQR
jgi:hypothetical protein